MLDQKIVRYLEKELGKNNFSIDWEDRILYSYDAMNQEFLPDGVAFPENTSDVAKILKIANENLVPVIPRGAGSGLTGGSVPVKGGIVLSFENMNRIKKIDVENLTAVVEPGVITGELHHAVESRGLFYPPDPASLEFCTIGGNVAENAGGLRAVKYGVTKDYVLGLEVVLPDGSIISPGLETVKGVVGYDLTRLIVGSEGTLGVITEVILKLIPKPQAKITFFAAFSNLEDSLNVVTDIFKKGVLPSTIEFIDRTCIQILRKYKNLQVSDETEAILLIEDDGSESSVKEHGYVIEAMLKNRGAIFVEQSTEPERIQLLWAARRALSPSLARVAPYKFNEDVTVPRNRLYELLNATYRIGERHNVKIANFGHAGDGNIHVNVLYSDFNEKERAHGAVEEIMRTTVALGGTISGEHGIGIAKKPYIGIELSSGEIKIMKKIKDVFDPNNILNPGKIFPE